MHSFAPSAEMEVVVSHENDAARAAGDVQNAIHICYRSRRFALTFRYCRGRQRFRLYCFVTTIAPARACPALPFVNRSISVLCAFMPKKKRTCEGEKRLGRPGLEPGTNALKGRCSTD